MAVPEKMKFRYSQSRYSQSRYSQSRYRKADIRKADANQNRKADANQNQRTACGVEFSSSSAKPAKNPKVF
jgi:hypothetical protein